MSKSIKAFLIFLVLISTQAFAASKAELIEEYEAVLSQSPLVADLLPKVRRISEKNAREYGRDYAETKHLKFLQLAAQKVEESIQEERDAHTRAAVAKGIDAYVRWLPNIQLVPIEVADVYAPKNQAPRRDPMDYTLK